MGLEEKSYEIHQQLYKNSGDELEFYKNWFDKNTTDLWRHKRMLSVLDPFLKHHNSANWLTVGDGRFGTSASYINRNGGKATASDIDTSLLEMARKNGMLDSIAYANAEKLPFNDNQFDYSYCKQAYHHFPRPTLAVYEMLRVSKEAIIFTEPHDFYPPPLLRFVLQKIKHFIKKSLAQKIEHPDKGNYEPVGNYVYGISIREFEKIALGLGLPAIAYKLYHDAYIPGVEKETFAENAPLFQRLKSEINQVNFKTRIGITRPNNIQAIVFKNRPSEDIEKQLMEDGYTVTHFAKNPYI